MKPAGWWQAGAQPWLARHASEPLPDIAGLRAAAAASFARTGFPGPREEAWHYTSLRPLAEADFFQPGPKADAAALLARLPAITAPRLVFADGIFRADLSRLPDFPVRTGEPAFAPLTGDEKLVALNTMFARDGAAIDIPENTDAGTLLLVHLGLGGGAHHPRHAVHLHAGAHLTLIEIAAGEGAYFHNPVLAITVEAGAKLVHLRQQTESQDAFHVSTTYVDVATNGVYDSFSLILGGRLARTETHARLTGTQATAHLNAAQLLAGRQHADFTTVVTHDAPATASRQTVKNVLTGRSRGVFQGKILVERVAQKTDGYQMNQALLLSPDAEIDTKPQLEIYADDVKCSHGATVGALDPEQLFYLRSRGIPETDARRMLVRAFLAEALDPIVHAGAHTAMDLAIANWWKHQAP